MSDPALRSRSRSSTADAPRYLPRESTPSSSPPSSSAIESSPSAAAASTSVPALVRPRPLKSTSSASSLLTPNGDSAHSVNRESDDEPFDHSEAIAEKRRSSVDSESSTSGELAEQNPPLVESPRGTRRQASSAFVRSPAAGVGHLGSRMKRTTQKLRTGLRSRFGKHDDLGESGSAHSVSTSDLQVRPAPDKSRRSTLASKIRSASSTVLSVTSPSSPNPSRRSKRLNSQDVNGEIFTMDDDDQQSIGGMLVEATPVSSTSSGSSKHRKRKDKGSKDKGSKDKEKDKGSKDKDKDKDKERSHKEKGNKDSKSRSSMRTTDEREHSPDALLEGTTSTELYSGGESTDSEPFNDLSAAMSVDSGRSSRKSHSKQERIEIRRKRSLSASAGEHEAMARTIAAQLREKKNSSQDAVHDEASTNDGDGGDAENKHQKKRGTGESAPVEVSSLDLQRRSSGHSPKLDRALTDRSASTSPDPVQLSRFYSQDGVVREKSESRSGSSSPVLSRSPAANQSQSFFGTRSSKDFVLRKKLSTSENTATASSTSTASLEALDALLMSRGPATADAPPPTMNRIETVSIPPSTSPSSPSPLQRLARRAKHSSKSSLSSMQTTPPLAPVPRNVVSELESIRAEMRALETRVVATIDAAAMEPQRNHERFRQVICQVGMDLEDNMYEVLTAESQRLERERDSVLKAIRSTDRVIHDIAKLQVKYVERLQKMETLITDIQARQQRIITLPDVLAAVWRFLILAWTMLWTAASRYTGKEAASEPSGDASSSAASEGSTAQDTTHASDHSKDRGGDPRISLSIPTASLRHSSSSSSSRRSRRHRTSSKKADKTANQ